VVRNNHRKRVSCHSGCVMQKKAYRHFKEVSSGCKKRSGGSTGYQRCNSSDILLLEDNSDEHYTAKCWKD